MAEKIERVSAREAIIVWVVTLVFAPLAASGLAGAYYFDRPFWSDEVSTWLIASDPKLQHGMAALAGGVDTNAPLLYLLLHAVGAIFGATPLTYRLTCAAGMAAAMAGLYLILRRTVRVGPAVFGCLCLLALPIMIAHATEARFYSFELAAFVWMAIALDRRRDQATAGNAAAVSVCSAMLCGIHYFGIVALVGLVIANACRARSALPKIDQLFPTIAGAVMTACLLPLLAAQRAAMRDGGGTWVADDFGLNLHTTLSVLLPAPAVIGFAIAIAFSVRGSGIADCINALRNHRGLLLASAVYIVAMLLIDRLAQPVFVPRYFIVALPAIAALMASLASRWPTPLLRLATGGVVALIAIQLCQIRIRAEHPSGRSAAGLIASVGGVDADVTIISDWMGHAVPIAVGRPDLRDRVACMDDDRIRVVGFDQAIRFVAQTTRCMQMFYDIPYAARRRDVQQLDHFVLLSEFPETLDARFPEFQRRALGEVTFEMTRNDSGGVAGAAVGSANGE